VDNNVTCRAALAELLASWQVEVETAATAEEALARTGAAAASDRPFAAVLLDLDLPGAARNGLLRQLRARRAGRRLPAVLLSTPGAAGASRPLRTGSRTAVVAKPVREVALREALEATLGAGAPEGEAAAAPPSPTGALAPLAAPAPVLVAEDHPVNRRLLGRMLARLGLEVVFAEDGVVAVELFRKRRFALVLMDCQMPRLDGYGATAAIRRLEAEAQRPPTPILALTAHAMPGERERCLAAGMDDYLTKPLTIETLHGAMGRWLRRQQIA